MHKETNMNWYKLAQDSVFKPQEYIDLKSDPLPYTTKWGFTIEGAEGECPDCKNKLTNMKQVINEYSNFVLMKGVGICLDCNLVISVHPVKITKEGKYFVMENGRWMEITGTESWKDKILNWFKII